MEAGELGDSDKFQLAGGTAGAVLKMADHRSFLLFSGCKFFILVLFTGFTVKENTNFANAPLFGKGKFITVLFESEQSDFNLFPSQRSMCWPARKHEKAAESLLEAVREDETEGTEDIQQATGETKTKIILAVTSTLAYLMPNI
ncbi:hypothetical protein DSO57_1027083 [Entomophthora muscae]|uniref:Uncharacterized protein n=1 Tax=Entomophthora muscae TaxID=34485 RepID=A0ACC2T1Q7_9FUNG|nr:hypothetical protein DSO57_1027083 [Entomophthora muscae]